MPTPSEHLAAAEELAAQARTWLIDGQLELARAYKNMASLYVDISQARYSIIGDGVPTFRPREPLADWCGRCQGPDARMRWVVIEADDGHETVRRCPNCHPASILAAQPSQRAPHDEVPASKEEQT
ncbi:hypothetical protein [Streptomyces olivaceus]|uniref:hypothetical protein n=1 Tax=Streptomyces olivaceus TaxID=47716 RepID=UPI0036767F41